MGLKDVLFSVFRPTLTGDRIMCSDMHLLLVFSGLIVDVQIWHMYKMSLNVQEYVSRGGEKWQAQELHQVHLGEKGLKLKT